MTAIRARLGALLPALHQRYAESRARRFLRWWGGQLLPMVPARCRALFRPRGQRVLCRICDRALHVGADDVEGEREVLCVPLAQADALVSVLDAALPERYGPRSHWLLVGPEQVLRRRLTLPLAALDRLREVLAFELDRQTPFQADQVVFDHRVLRRDDGTRQLQVELIVLPNTALDPALAVLSSLGLHGVDVLTGDGRRLGVNLLPPERRARRRDPVGRLNLALMAASVVTLLFALGTALDNRSLGAAVLNERVEAARADARHTAELRQQLVDAAEAASFLDDAGARQPPLIEVLAELTQRLPDDTWLERLTISDGKLGLVVYSDEAAALVASLQESRHLSDAALSGAVQADPNSGRDRFTISAAVVMPKAGEPPSTDLAIRGPKTPSRDEVDQAGEATQAIEPSRRVGSPPTEPPSPAVATPPEQQEMPDGRAIAH